MRRPPLAACALALLLGSGVHAGPPAAEVPVSPNQQRARELSWSGDYPESLALYEELLAEHEEDPELELEVGRVLLWAGREPEALSRFERVLYADPAHAEARLSAARALYYQGKAAEAVPHYQVALPRYEGDPSVVAEAVRVFRSAGRTELAERWLDRGLERHPDDPDLRVAHAAVLTEEAHFPEAQGELEAVLAAHPDHEAARELLESLDSGRAPVEVAQRLGNAGRYGPAKRLLRTHLGSAPDDAEARLLLARFAAWSGDYTVSQESYARLLEQAPGDRALRSELADVTSWRGEYGEALARYGTLHREDPDDLRVRLGIANVHLWSGVHRYADRDLRAILALDPEHEGAQEQLKHLERLRAPAFEPAFSWFRDSEDFRLSTASTSVRLSPAPGRSLALSLDAPLAEGRFFELDPISGLPVERRESVQGLGVRLGFEERPEQGFAYGGELGAVTYEGVGTSPRASLHGTWYPDYRHALRAEILHEDALPAVRSIQSATRGIERSLLRMVHSYRGERLTSWTLLEGGRYSDDPSFWMARTVLGYGLLRAPFEVDALALAAAGGFDEPSPSYYSPEDLLHYAVGLRLKKSLPGRADFLLIGEVGRIREDGFRGDTFRIAPELRLQIRADLELSLRYDHYRSVRSGAGYDSDFASARLVWRFPGRP